MLVRSEINKFYPGESEAKRISLLYQKWAFLSQHFFLNCPFYLVVLFRRLLPCLVALKLWQVTTR